MFRNFVILIFVILMLPAMVGRASQDDAEAADAHQTVSIVISPEEQEAALQFWTREVIGATEPLDMPYDTDVFSEQLNDADEPEADETEAAEPYGSVPGSSAAPDADKIAQDAYPLDWQSLEIVDVNAAEELAANDLEEINEISGTSGIYTSYVANQYSSLQRVYPHKWVGRLSFRTPQGTSFCSGASIRGNVVLTAAHCLYDTSANRWHSNVVFTPAYRAGSAPYGSFAASQCWVLTNWINLSGSYSIKGWARHDVGVCTVGRNSAGQTLSNAVGYLGREWNSPFKRHVHNMGYPFVNYRDTQLSNAGRYLRTCVAETRWWATATRGMGCNFGGGISGGPWITRYAPNVVSGYATGVNSGIYLNSQNIYGPRFTSSNIVPLCNAAGC